jgi:hypothetical protein
MSTATVDLEDLVQDCVACLGDAAANDPAAPETTMRERFFELMVLILGNLYSKTPVAGALFDRTTLLRVTAGMDDADAGKLAQRIEDWMRLESLLRQQDGQKAYFVTRPTLSVLSTITSSGTLGEVFDRILKRYAESMPSENIRRSARMLGSYFLTRVARS